MTAVTSVNALSTITKKFAASLPIRPRFTGRSRWARRLGVVDGCELWVLAWLPGQGTDLHDHGGNHTPAPAAFAVAEGTLTEFTVVPGEFPSLDRREVAAGEASVVDERTIHAVANRGDEPAVSVHAYAPRLSLMRGYLFDETGLWLASMKRAGEDW